MEILTFSETASHFEVSLATISRWVKEGKLVEGAKAGKSKTVTQNSIEALSNDEAFQIGLKAIKKKQATIHKLTTGKEEELEDLKMKVKDLESTVNKMSKDLIVVQNFAQNCTKEIEELRKVAQVFEKKDSKKKATRSTKSRTKQGGKKV